MKRKILLLALALIISLSPTIALASDITGAIWQGAARITNANAGAVSNASVNMSLNTASLISNGYLNATASDGAIQINGTDTSFMPGYGSNPWMVFVPSLSGASNVDYDFYSGNVTGGKIRFFGTLSVPDSANLEHGANFTPTFSGYVDTAILNSIIINKAGAYGILTGNTTGNVTARIYDSPTNQTLRPNQSGDETNITSIGGGSPTHWEAVSDINDATQVYTSSDTYLRDLYSIPSLTTTNGTISSVTIYFRIADDNAGGTAYAIPHFKIGATVYSGTEQTQVGVAYATKSQTYTVSPATNAAWTIDEINDMQIGVSLKEPDGGGNAVLAAEVYIIVDYSPLTRLVSVSGVPAGEVLIQSHSDSVNFWLTVDTADTLAHYGSANVSAVGVPNNANSYTIGSTATPYIEYVSMTVGGNLRGYWDWDYAATFTDQSGNGNTATPSFRTTSSDSNVSAELVTLSPVNQAEIDTFSLSGLSDIYALSGNIPQMYSDMDFSNFGPAEPINDLLDESGTPRALWWYPFLFISVGLIGLLAYGATTLAVSRGKVSVETVQVGSLFLMAIVIDAPLATLGIMGIIPYAASILFWIPAIAIILSVNTHKF